MKFLKSMFSLLLLFVSGTAFSETCAPESFKTTVEPDFKPLTLKIYDYKNNTYKFLPNIPKNISLKDIEERVKLQKDEVIVIYNAADRDNTEPRNIQTLGK